MYTFIKAYVVGTHRQVDAIQMSTHKIGFFIRKSEKNRINIIK